MAADFWTDGQPIREEVAFDVATAPKPSISLHTYKYNFTHSLETYTGFTGDGYGNMTMEISTTDEPGIWGVSYVVFVEFWERECDTVTRKFYTHELEINSSNYLVTFATRSGGFGLPYTPWETVWEFALPDPDDPPDPYGRRHEWSDLFENEVLDVGKVDYIHAGLTTVSYLGQQKAALKYTNTLTSTHFL
ncbi:MAG: hypothetical protein Kow0069_21060 [Promethearchaeota archaeon]